MNYRRDIDGLRAVAVLPVVLFHFGVSAISYARPACTRFNERALSIIRDANIQ